MLPPEALGLPAQRGARNNTHVKILSVAKYQQTLAVTSENDDSFRVLVRYRLREEIHISMTIFLPPKAKDSVVQR